MFQPRRLAVEKYLFEPGDETSMAMTMMGEVTLRAERARVWAMLNDPIVLKACIPGCQSLDKTGDSSFSAVANIRRILSCNFLHERGAGINHPNAAGR